MEVKFDMNIKSKLIFGYLQAMYSHNFLLTILIDGLDQHR